MVGASLANEAMFRLLRTKFGMEESILKYVFEVCVGFYTYNYKNINALKLK